jgi:hypothetical protein
MTDLFLMFAMGLDDDRTLNRGRLILIDRQKGMIGRWVATSGLGAYQGVGDWNHAGGGVLPATYQLKSQIPWYKVAIKPLDLSSVRGVEGNGYPITPIDFETEGGTDRGDVLIHRDANVPGTLGCIGVKGEAEFADFERSFNESCLLLPKGQTTVDLGVIYTY